MDIEIQTHRIKVSQPRVMLHISGPFINEFTEEETKQNEQLDALNDEYNKKLEEIFGKPAENSWAGKYYWADWMNREGQLAYAFAIENFKSFLRHLAAEQYALYVDNKAVRDAETKTA